MLTSLLLLMSELQLVLLINYYLNPPRPDEPSQLNMAPGDAAGFWKAEVEPKKNEGYDLWGPAVTSSSRGEAWMDSFLAACAGGCSVSAPVSLAGFAINVSRSIVLPQRSPFL